MRIYMAAFYHSGGGRSTSMAPNLRVKVTTPHEWFLESYHYLKDEPFIEDSLRDTKSTIFLDSGAFSMFTQKVEVNLKNYAEYIRCNKDIIHTVSNLDAIGAGKEEWTYKNQKELENYDVGFDIGPVHHARDHDRWLKRYLNEGYNYIFLGGMVPETTSYLLNWLDHIWHNYLTNSDGTPNIKVHGFGLTALNLMYRYPWYSVDSTAWVMSSRFGAVYMDFPQPDGTVKDRKIVFSNKSPNRRDINSWHFDTLSNRDKKTVLDRLEQLETERLKDPQMEEEVAAQLGFKQGYNVEALSQMYGWRDHFNVCYFKRAQNLHNVTHFKKTQKTLEFF